MNSVRRRPAARNVSHLRAAALLLIAVGGYAVPATAGAQVRDPYPTKPPAAAPVKPAQFPPFQETTLANGLRVVLVENHKLPVLSLSLSFPAGISYVLVNGQVAVDQSRSAAVRSGEVLRVR